MERIIDLDRNVFIEHNEFIKKPIPYHYATPPEWVTDDKALVSSMNHWLNCHAKGWVYNTARKYVFERKQDMVAFVFWLKCQDWKKGED